MSPKVNNRARNLIFGMLAGIYRFCPLGAFGYKQAPLFVLGLPLYLLNEELRS